MLRITLRDGEKAIVNGAVIRAVGRTQIMVENKVAILRGREVMRPEDATTPARQLYFAAMLAYIDPTGRDAHHESVVALLAALVAGFSDPEGKLACARFAGEIARGDYYRALGEARTIIEHETRAAEPQAA